MESEGKKITCFRIFLYSTSRFNGRKDELFVKIWYAVIRAIFGVEKEKLYPRNVVSKTKRKSVLLFIFIEKRSNKGYTYTES